MPSGKCGVCSKPALHKCSDCKQVSYCSKEHQKEDWKTHKIICRPFEIRTSPELGNYLVATRNLAPGNVILTENPIVVGPKLHMNSIVCLRCLSAARLDPDYRCPRCQWPTCGPSCTGDPKGIHAAECSVLCLKSRRSIEAAADKGAMFYHYDAIMTLRCLLLQRKSPRKWQQILQMESHYKHRGPGTETYKEIRDRVSDYLRENFLKELEEMNVLTDVSEKTVHLLCGVIDVNALEIPLPLGSEVMALYPTAYLLEHNCLPNTQHTFETAPGDHQFRLTVTAAKHILKGEPISTMYTHALWGTQARRQHLKTTKYFDCKCKRCSDPTELDTYLSAMRCLGAEIMNSDNDQDDGSQCGGIQLPVDPLNDASDWRCNKCPVSLSSDQVKDLTNRIGEDIDIIQATQPAVKELEDLISKLSKFLHPNHYHLYSIKHSLVQLYGHQQGYKYFELSDHLLEKKLNMCKDLLAVTDALDAGSSRLVLYSSVLLLEMQSTVLTQAQRKYVKGIIDKKQLKEFSQMAHKLLNCAIESLKYEPPFSPGRKLSEIADQHLSELHIWEKNMNI